MKQSRLDQLLEKANNNEISIAELTEICAATLQSVSRHSNDIKNKLDSLEKKIAQLETELNKISEFEPVFGVIDEMDDD